MKQSKYGYRINQLSNNASGYTWLFLPGGPGLGSEYLIDFCKTLQLPGSIYVLDFPMDGTNINGNLDFAEWRKGLIDLLTNFQNTILVTHSFSGMFALSMPEIENYLTGMVLMNTTTKNSFFEHVAKMHALHQLPDLVPAASAYHLNPSNETYKSFWETYKYYCFTQEEMSQGEEMMKLFAYNNAAYHYAITHFYADYESKFSSSQLPIMTITSADDYVCPPDIFISDKNFQSNNILNKIIPEAGHCPWVMHFNAVQAAFNEYIAKIEIS